MRNHASVSAAPPSDRIEAGERVLIARADRAAPPTGTTGDGIFTSTQTHHRIELTRKSVWVGRDRAGQPFVRHAEAEFLRGTNTTRRGGKAWARWNTRVTRTLLARPDRTWLLRQVSAGRFKNMLLWPEMPGRQYEPFVSDGFLSEIAGEFLPPPVAFGSYYPLADWYHLDPRTAGDGTWLNSTMRRAFVGAEDMQDLTRRLFGPSRYRRDLVKGVARADLGALWLAWQFRGLVPVDWLVEILARPLEHHGRDIRPHLRRLDLQSLRNLVHDLGRDDPRRIGMWIHDTARARQPDEPGRVRSWRELHDVAHEYTRTYGHLPAGRARYTQVQLPDEVKVLAGRTPGGRQVTLARHEDTLWQWGREMGNCIGGYGADMRNKTAVLGGVSDGEGTLLANFEVRRGSDANTFLMVDADQERALGRPRLVQLFGPHNQPLPDALRADIEEHLRNHDIHVPTDYWGATRAA